MSTPGQRADLWTCRVNLLAVAELLCDTVDLMDTGLRHDAGQCLTQASDRLCVTLLQFRGIVNGKA